MDPLERYSQALHPDTHRVLGRRLRPLAVGHILLLTRLGNPIITGRGVIDDVAIAVVVFLCSMPYAQAKDAMQGRWLKLRLAWLALRARSDTAAVAQLACYMESGAKGPRWWTESNSSAEVETPTWLLVQVTLQRDLGLTLSQALDTPACLAMWWCAAIWEETGRIDLISREEEEILRNLKTEASPAARN